MKIHRRGMVMINAVLIGVIVLVLAGTGFAIWKMLSITAESETNQNTAINNTNENFQVSNVNTSTIKDLIDQIPSGVLNANANSNSSTANVNTTVSNANINPDDVSLPEGWILYSPNSKRFTVALPENPKVNTTTTTDPAGSGEAISKTTYGVESALWSYELTTESYPTEKITDTTTYFNTVGQLFTKIMTGNILVSSAITTHQSYPAAEYIIRNNTFRVTLKVRVILVESEKMRYSFIAVIPTSTFKESDTDAFFYKFELAGN